MKAGKVLIAAPIHPVLSEGLREKGFELIVDHKIRQDDAASYLHDCVGVITSTRLQLDKNLIDGAPVLKWIARMGSGMEVIDVAYAGSKGIRCFSSPEGNCNAVAEHALGLLLGITKRINQSAEQVTHGLWLREENRGIELEGKTIGIIGFGHTGRAFAKKLQGMDMRILAYDKQPILDVPSYVELCPDLEPIWKAADIVSFHVPMAPDTYHYLDNGFLNRLEKPVIVLNTSRGTVIEASVLAQGLENGRIIGAGLDVWEEEPIAKMSPVLKELLLKISSHQGVIITPHIAGYTKEALYKMSNVLLMNILRLTDL